MNGGIPHFGPGTNKTNSQPISSQRTNVANDVDPVAATTIMMVTTKSASFAFYSNNTYRTGKNISLRNICIQIPITTFDADGCITAGKEKFAFICAVTSHCAANKNETGKKASGYVILNHISAIDNQIQSTTNFPNELMKGWHMYNSTGRVRISNFSQCRRDKVLYVGSFDEP